MGRSARAFALILASSCSAPTAAQPTLVPPQIEPRPWGTLVPQPSAVTPVASSGDGRFVALADEQRLVVYDAATRAPVFELNGVYGAAFGVGDTLAVRHLDGALRVWSLQTGNVVTRLASPGKETPPRQGTTWPGMRPKEQAFATSDDGKVLVAAEGLDLCVWSLPEGKLERSWRDGDSPFHAVAISGNGRAVIAASLQSITVFDVATGTTLERRSHPGGRPSLSVDIDADGRWAAMIPNEDNDGPAVVWEVGKGAAPRTLGKVADRYRARALRFSADGKLLWLGTSDKTHELWDIEAQKLRFKIDKTGAVARTKTGFLIAQELEIKHAQPQSEEWAAAVWAGAYPAITALALDDDGSTLAIGRADGELTQVSLQPARQAGALARGSTKLPKEVTAISISKSGAQLAAAAEDAGVFMWQSGATPRAVEQKARTAPPFVDHVMLSDAGDRLAFGGFYGVELVDAQSGRLLASHEGALSFGAPISSSATSAVILNGGVEPIGGGRVKLMSLTDGKLVRSATQNEGSRVWATVTANADVLAAGLFWPSTREPAFRPGGALSEHMAVSRDGHTLAVNTEQQIAIRELPSFNTRALVSHPLPERAPMALSGNGAVLATAQGTVVHLFRTTDGAALGFLSARKTGELAFVAADGSVTESVPGAREALSCREGPKLSPYASCRGGAQ